MDKENLNKHSMICAPLTYKSDNIKADAILWIGTYTSIWWGRYGMEVNKHIHIVFTGVFVLFQLSPQE